VPSVSTQGQSDSVHFDSSSASDIASHNLLLRKLSNFGLFSGYIKLFHSYLTNRQYPVLISDTLSFWYVVKSGVP
jgi:hypothetical protein